MELIGVAGAGNGTGTTHTVCLLANYLWGVKQIKTAAIQKGDSRDFQKIAKAYMGQACFKRTGEEKFRMLGVDYYSRMQEEILTAENMEGYGCAVVDFGNILEGSRTEFLCCKRKLLIISLCEWQLDGWLEFFAEFQGKWKNITFGAVFGSEDLRKEAERRLGKAIIRIPFSPDPFVVTGELITLFEKL